MPPPAFSRLLAGKSGEGSGSLWLPLWVHARDTAEVMARLVNTRLPAAAREAIGLEDDELRRVAWFLGAAHDIGKATALFQSNVTLRIPDAHSRLTAAGVGWAPFRNPDKSHHALAGEAIALGLGCPQGLASVIGAHHGRPQAAEAVRDQEGFCDNYWTPGQEDLWRGMWQALWQEALSGAGYASAADLPELEVPAELLLTGLLTMADWIASNTRYFPLLPVEEAGDETLWPTRAEKAWDSLRSARRWTRRPLRSASVSRPTRFRRR